MYALIGAIIGLLIYHAVIKPIERKRYREMCIKEGLAPKEEDHADGA
jgi:hypothetical protein